MIFYRWVTICTNKIRVLCPFKSTKGMLNGCYDYGGESLKNALPCKGSLALNTLRTSDMGN